MRVKEKLALSLLCCMLAHGTGHAVVVLDGTVGAPANAGVAVVGPNYAIPAALGTQVGANLFHSFQTFGVETGGSATFSGPVNVANIISRVTGGAASLIDGALISTIPGANLYLINPSGMMFGPNASLNLTGSFHAGTANHLLFADGSRFDATTPANSVLTSAPPAAFGFLNPATAAPVTVQGSQLAVPLGQTLHLAGGNFDIQANSTLSAPSGAINIESQGAVLMGNAASLRAPDGGTIYIRANQLTLNPNATISTENTTGTGGLIDINVAGTVTLDGGRILSTSWGAGNAGNILINAGTVRLLNYVDPVTSLITASAIDSSSGGWSWVWTTGITPAIIGLSGQPGSIDVVAANAIELIGYGPCICAGSYGNAALVGTPSHISLTAPNISILGGNVLSDTLGTGNAANITFNANSINLSDQAWIFSNAYGSGNAGNIAINSTGALNLTGWAHVDSGTWGSGNAGNVSLNGTNVTVDGSSITSNTNGSGNAGNIAINASAGSVNLANGAYISSGTWSWWGGGMGNAGNITVNATGAVSLTNWASLDSSTWGAGSAGNISLNGSSVTVDGSSITSNTLGSGNAGNIAINASTGSVNLANGAYISSGAWDWFGGGSGNAGNITVNATGAVNLINWSFVDSSTWGAGSAGNVSLNGSSVMVDGGYITSNTSGSGSAGNIAINATGAVNLTNGAYITSANSGYWFDWWTLTLVPASGNAGNIAINGSSVTVDNSWITSSTGGSGNAGNITVNANNVSVLQGGSISSGADAGSTGQAGHITLSATDSIVVSGADALGKSSEISIRNDGNSASATNSSYIHLDTSRLVVDGGSINASTSGISTQQWGWGLVWGYDWWTGGYGWIWDWAPVGTVIGGGNAGSIVVNAGTVSLLNGGRIDSSTTGTGMGGDITINASGKVDLSAGIISANSAYSGAGGHITLNAAGGLSLDNGSQITASSTATGTAGNININAGSTLTLNHNSSITTAALQSDGGNIRVVASNLIYLKDSEITATVQGGMGNGGNIFIDPIFVVLSNSNVIANAFGGNGGNINIVANNFIATPNSTVSASSQQAVSGTVSITAQLTDISSSLSALPVAFLKTGLLGERCAAKMAGKPSSFVMAGRGGISLEPDSMLPSTFTALSSSIMSTPVASKGLGMKADTFLALADGFACTK